MSILNCVFQPLGSTAFMLICCALDEYHIVLDLSWWLHNVWSCKRVYTQISLEMMKLSCIHCNYFVFTQHLEMMILVAVRRVNKTITEILLDLNNTVRRRVLVSDLFPCASQHTSQHTSALVLSALLRPFSTCTMLWFLREDQNKAPWLLLIPLSAMFKAPKHCRVMYSLMDRVTKTITEVLPDVDNTVRRGVLISGFFPFKSQHTCKCPGFFCIPLSFVNLHNAGSREKTRPKLCSCSYMFQSSRTQLRSKAPKQ